MIQQQLLEVLDTATFAGTVDGRKRENSTVRTVGAGAIGLEVTAKIEHLWYPHLQNICLNFDKIAGIIFDHSEPTRWSPFDSNLTDYMEDYRMRSL
jgi:NADH dehydrogenase FAD-containing subunit